MTRETKIGLLVGLAFIIVIGILLSDYNRIENQQAPLYGATKDVRQSTATPGANDNRTDVTVVAPPQQVSPRQIVPMREEVNGSRDDHSSAVVTIRPGTGNPTLPDPSHPATTEPTDDNPPVVLGSGSGAADADPIDVHAIPHDLRQAAADHHEQIVSVGPHGEARSNNGANSNSASTNSIPANPPTTAGKQYTAISGDTVSKLAGRFMGGNTKANRDAIVAANPSLQKNVNNIIVGKVYMIPVITTSVSSAGNSDRAKPPTPVVATNNDKPLTGPQFWYTVKENDSLWKIAQEQLGDGNAWAAIKELNKDVLKGKDDLHPNMRLKLPAKPLASAS